MPEPRRSPAARHQGLRRRGLTRAGWPAGRGERRSAGPLWPAACLGIGLIAGPVIALAVNHGHPRAVVNAIAAAPLLVLVALFFAVAIHLLHGNRRAAFLRVLAVLVFGSVIFVLPNSLNLPATGDLWWATVLEKYAISCVPYPFIGWLVMPGIRRRLAVEVCLLLTAASALAWPALLRVMRDQTADVLRRELALPPSMLYVLAMPGAETVRGYSFHRPAVSLGYRLPASAHPHTPNAPDLGYDVDIVVFPATDASPCGRLPGILADVDGFNREGMSCSQTAAGLWQAADDGAFEALDDVTEVERIDGDYVAVTIGQRSQRFDGEFAVLFADLRHPDSAQLVDVGLAGGPSPLE